MEIYFLRHGEAQERKEMMRDENRPLTSFGAVTISNVGRSLSETINGLDLILTSPLLRARQTADIIGNIFGRKERLFSSESLLVGAPPSLLLTEIKKYKALKRIIVIGHQPHLGMCVSFLTEKDEERASIKKGGCALVKIEKLKKGEGELIWIKEPSDFKLS